MVEDESAPVPFVIGEVFAHLGLEEAKVCVASTSSGSPPLRK